MNFFWFFPHPPHHFSNGPSLKLPGLSRNGPLILPCVFIVLILFVKAYTTWYTARCEFLYARPEKVRCGCKSSNLDIFPSFQVIFYHPISFVYKLDTVATTSKSCPSVVEVWRKFKAKFSSLAVCATPYCL